MSKEVIFQIPEKLSLFIQAVHKQHTPKVPNVLNLGVCALDPGETTGVATFIDSTIHVHQRETKNIGQSFEWLQDLLAPGSSDRSVNEARCGDLPFAHLRYEDYRVYKWKTDDHAWSPVHTIQWIGAIQVAAHMTQVPSSCIMASHAKNFWTDEKLNLFDVNPKGLRHGRDALRHLLYYLCFPTN